jgi:UDP-N-acetylglucosamine--N-acetylmuramyl-(pentapeptide) pyrophosphoryl-undecaprenol N-acetylglucosamine transferase
VKKVFLITGGGTGGHLSVASSFIEHLYKKNYTIIFVGSSKGQDKQWFEQDSRISQKYFFETKGVVNQKGLAKIQSLWLILTVIVKVVKIIKNNQVQKVISVGGFSAAAASFAALLTRTDFYIHEQNSVMGKLNQITSRFAKEVFSSYSETSKVKDYPIDEKFFAHQRVRKEIKTVIFLGGSQGAKAINDFALQVASELNELGIQIIHQAGKNDIQRVQKEYQNLGLEVDLFDFTPNLLEKMDQADFAISRAGASTLWELVALGIPTFFIPYPYAAADHQYHNAKYLLDQNLCFLQREKELNAEYFFQSLHSDIESKSEQLKKLIHKDAVKNIVDVIES